MACQEITKFSQQTEFKNFGYSITNCDGSIIIKATNYITEPVFKYWNNNTTSKITENIAMQHNKVEQVLQVTNKAWMREF